MIDIAMEVCTVTMHRTRDLAGAYAFTLGDISSD